MSDRKLSIFLFRIIPTNLLSRIFGIITDIPFPGFILNRVIDWYCNKFSVKKDEMLIPDEGFRTLDKFFTRALKPGVIIPDNSPDAIVSPVDARIDQFGKIETDSIMQAKGLDYTLKDLLPSSFAENFINGSFITLYLSPGDYHRIHSPVKGIVTGYNYIPGKLFTVQEYMAKGLPGLFSKNERLITYMDSSAGRIAVCKIGAMNVGRISHSFSDVVTNKTFRKKKEILFNKGNTSPVNAGDELGIFHLGSTVIILFERDSIEFSDFTEGNTVRVGQRIGHITR